MKKDRFLPIIMLMTVIMCSLALASPAPMMGITDSAPMSFAQAEDGVVFEFATTMEFQALQACSNNIECASDESYLWQRNHTDIWTSADIAARIESVSGGDRLYLEANIQEARKTADRKRIKRVSRAES
jgi:hypothetical protein